MQGTWVRALVQEDPTCHGATKPMSHNYWGCTLEPASHNYWIRTPQLLKPACLEPVLHNKRSQHNKKPMHCNEEYPLLSTRESPRMATKNQRSQESINQSINLSSLSTWINFTSGWYLGGSPKCKIQFNLAPNNTITSANCKALLKRKIWYNKKDIYILIWIILKLISKVFGKV